MIRRRTLLAAAGGTALGGALATGTARADATIAVNPATTYGRWEGWGTSLAWWANVFGARDDFADLFFTTRSTTYDGASRPGLDVPMFVVARPLTIGLAPPRPILFLDEGLA